MTRADARGGLTLTRSTLVLRSASGRHLSGRVGTRLLWTSAASLLLCLLVVVAALMLGRVVFSPSEVLAALTGRGTSAAELFVVSWRLPRAVCSVLFGAMLGVSGAIFQTITRNPLGSPDIIGFTSGAYTGGVLSILVLGSSYHVVAGGALAGGLASAALIYLLSRQRGVQGFRLIVVGIGVTAMLTSFDTWLILTAELDLAVVAAVWGVGSLNGISPAYAGPSVVLGVLLLLAAVLVSRRLAQLDLGDDEAAVLGSSPETTRLLGIGVGVGLVAVVTSVAGPIAFVALAAPQVGRRVAGTPGTPMLPAACTGAVLLSVADLAAQHALPGLPLPVGLVTVAIGGLYLLALVVAENRRGAL